MSTLGEYFRSIVPNTKEAAPQASESTVSRLASLGVQGARAFVEAREKVATMSRDEISGFVKAAEYGRDLAREHFVREIEKVADQQEAPDEDVDEAKVLVAAAAAQALMSGLDEAEASDPDIQEHVIRTAARIAETQFDPSMLFSDGKQEGGEAKKDEESDGKSEKGKEDGKDDDKGDKGDE